jgi:hypothetical protein
MATRRRRSSAASGIKGHHAEWLSMLEVSGPFLSLPVLVDAFPQELDVDDSKIAARTGVAYDEWLADRDEPDIHAQWIRFVLDEILEFPDSVIHDASAFDDRLQVRIAEQHAVLKPHYVITEPGKKDAPGTPRLLIQVTAPGQKLDAPIPGQSWKASPATRMAELLRGHGGKPLGLLTNGDRWMLVSARPEQTATFASWYANLWTEERLLFRAFRSLLGVRRFFSVADNEKLPALLERSADEQYEVTDRLGLQVRRSVELLVSAFDRIDRDRKGDLLTDLEEKDVYQAAVTVMMRLVFLLYAEDQELLPRGDALWDEHYAVGKLLDQLQADADEKGTEVLERRYSAWSRLLATFRAIYSGIRHEKLQLPAYGGDHFDPDRFPFLEGRSAGTSWSSDDAEPMSINDNEVLQILRSLQYLETAGPRGGTAEAQRISFRALGVEQIGGVYESLLDHTAVRAKSPALSLQGAKNREPEIYIEDLDTQRAAGDDKLVAYLKDETGKTPKAIEKSLDYAIPAEDTDKWVHACDGNQGLLEQVRPYAGLVREGDDHRPVIIPEGSMYVTQGSDRRSSGAHYTPPSLTEPIVRYTLEPLVYEGPAEGKPEEEWKLRAPREILALHVCDLAMGSGAFLVAACRYLAERLVEGWEECERANPGKVLVSPEGDVSEGHPSESLLPSDPIERLASARRYIADRCLYGVDKDPMAVEMGKLSLWLVTLQKGKPFNFLDHALKCGDSLLGISNRKQLEYFDYAADPRGPASLFGRFVREAMTTATEKREQLERLAVNDVRDAQEKRRLLDEANSALDAARLAADALAAAALSTACDKESAYETRRTALATAAGNALADDLDEATRQERLADLEREARKLLDEGKPASERAREPFHWPLEFPEVFENGGFDAFVGNPPFQGGKKISGAAGTDFREYLVKWLAGGTKGHADLVAYMFLRAAELLRLNGGFGLIATNTIAQGDTREVGLDRLFEARCSIPRAVSSQKWPGQANLEVAIVWLQRTAWSGSFFLDGEVVEGITPQLEIPGRVSGSPHRLAANEDKSFQGSIVLGMGFVLEPDEAKRLIEKDPKNREVLYPYLNGQDLNSRPDQSPSRWVVNFHDWPEEQAQEYPDCWDIIQREVRPERQRKKDNGSYALRKPLPQRYWHYADKRPKLYSTVRGMERVLVVPETTKYCTFSFCPTNFVFSHMTKVVALDSSSDFAILNSSLHELWARKYSPTLENRLRYSPSYCFENFPFPGETELLAQLGNAYCAHRSSSTKGRKIGTTKLYNCFHHPGEKSADIKRLRELHLEMDQAVAAAYGWDDLDLGHDFHETDQGTRYTLSSPARHKVLDLLLELNHQRYAEEVAQGLHDKKKPNPKQKTKSAQPHQTTLFDAPNGTTAPAAKSAKKRNS